MKSNPSLCSTTVTCLLVALAAACGNSKNQSSTDAGSGDGGSAGGSTGGNSDGGTSTGGNGDIGVGGHGTGGRSTGGNAAGGSSAGGNSGGGKVGMTALPVNLRTAGNFVILSKSGISTVPASVITGNLGVSPVTATAITQFSLTADSTNVFSTSAQVTGKIYAADYAAPTPATLTTAVGDMQLAFTDAAGRAPTVTELGAGSIGGMTLAGGVYKWGTGLLIATNVTLTGSATDVWIFQIAQDLTISNATRVSLVGGALPKNVFWQVAGGVVIGTTGHLEGVVLTQTSATLATGASIRGRLLAQTAVTLDTSTVTEPAP